MISGKRRGFDRPKVIDVGIAKATEFKLTHQSLGDNGAIVGTPAYMSPEQADPSSMDINTRTDIDALGDALKLSEETLALWKTKLGPDHPDALMSMIGLAESYLAVGRTREGISLLEEAASRKGSGSLLLLAAFQAQLGQDEGYAQTGQLPTTCSSGSATRKRKPSSRSTRSPPLCQSPTANNRVSKMRFAR